MTYPNIAAVQSERSSSSASISNNALWKSRAERFALAGVLILTAVIYALPWIFTSSGWRTGLPPIFAPDFYTYLNLSRIFKLAGVASNDPWYGVAITPQFGHSTFPLAFVVYGVLRRVFAGEMLTYVVWSVSWSILIACGFWFLLRNLVKDASVLVLFAGTSLLVFFSLDSLPIELAVFLHPFNHAIRDSLPLPFVRMFFPQIAVPMLAFYFLNLSCAWENNRPSNYLWMAALQFLAFLTFPYAAVFMGIATAIFLLLALRIVESRAKLMRVVVVGIVSVIADVVYLWAFLPHHVAATGSTALGLIFKFDWTQLRVEFGGTVILLILGGVACLVLGSRLPSHSIVASMGFANALMLLADVVIDPRFLFSHHAGYFVQTSLGLEILLLCCAMRRVISQQVFRLSMALLAVFVVCNGVLASWAILQSHSTANAYLTSFAEAINGLHLGPEDLVIAPATDVDDVSIIVPLISDSRVLYARNVEVLTYTKQQSERQGLYLFLRGQDAAWVTKSLAEKNIPSAVLTLGEGFALRDPRQRPAVENEVRERLVPLLTELEHGTKPQILQHVRRVVVLDFVATPLFDNSRINKLMTVSADYQSNGVHVLVGTAR